MKRDQRARMIDPAFQGLSISRQCKLVNISRSSVYYKPAPLSAEDLVIMKLIDQQYLSNPTLGSRSMVLHLERHHGHRVNRKKVQRLMRLMGIEAIYPRPKTSRPQPAHPVHPYLLRGLAIDRPNQVWTADITYIPMHRGFMYLMAVMDWHSRKVLAWRICNTLDADFCVDALNEALSRYGKPDIFNTDQGAQFTSQLFTATLKGAGVAISMDGRGRCQDNIFIERLWWTLKYHYIYLRAFGNGADLKRGLCQWFDFYNGQRPHQGLDGMTPDEVYYGLPGQLAKAA